jgi:creatinine amidohydrolase
MGVFTDRLETEVRLERMRPAQVEAARNRRPAMYVPFGSIEWHGHHNPVGLDAIKAHEQLVGLARRAGGVVYPAVYFGAGGGHLDWPSSYMVSAAPMAQLVAELLRGFERDGYRQAVLLSGHYPNYVQYLLGAVRAYRDAGGRMAVLSLIENQAPGVGGDHAAKHETSFMLYLHPDTVDGGALADASREDLGGPEEVRNWMDPRWRGHPCYGLVGIDPRAWASAAVGQESTELLLRHLEAWLSS